MYKTAIENIKYNKNNSQPLKTILKIVFEINLTIFVKTNFVLWKHLQILLKPKEKTKGFC